MDVTERIEVSKPSVSHTVKLLREEVGRFIVIAGCAEERL